MRLATAVAGLTLVAAACGSSNSTPTGTLPVAGIQRAIKASIIKERGITTVVVCPDGVPRRAGYRFTCLAKLNVGSYAVTVAELNARGNVSYTSSSPLRVIDTATIELAIRRALSRKRHVAASVTCPREVLQQKGLSFTCSAKTKHGVETFDVVEVDDEGHVRLRSA